MSLIRMLGLYGFLPSKRMTSNQRRINVDVTSRSRIDVGTTLSEGHVPDGYMYQLKQSISKFRGVGWCISFFFKILMEE